MGTEFYNDINQQGSMKVIHFLNELKFSGAEIMYVDAAPIFQELGCELTVVNTAEHLGEYSTAFEEAGYKVIQHPIPNRLFAQWKMRKEIIDLIRDGGYDVVHIHRSDLRWIVSYCAWKLGRRAIYTTHNVFRSHWYSYPLHFAQRWSASHIFKCTFQTISDSVDNNEKHYYHSKTRLVYNWYSNRRFSPANTVEKLEFRKELGIPADALVVVSVGGCSTIKRHEDILTAMADVVKECHNAVYLHLGCGTTTDAEKQMCHDLGLDGNVIFCGNQKNVRRFLAASDIYLMTSRFEGIPLTTIEAMGCCIPTILYNVPGLRDFNKERECSVLIPEDAHLLGKAIMELYKDPARQQILTKNAKSFVDDKFSMDKNARKIFELYNGD